jgi:hypothetical protein
MFEIEDAIADWRRKMATGGVNAPAVLDELEGHLRGDMRALLAAGTPEAQAFQMAVARLGNPGPLRTEFNKLDNVPYWPVTIGSGLFVAAIILCAAILLKKLLAGKLSLLLYAHILSVTAGYGAAFLAGGFGIFYVCARLFSAMPPNGRPSLGRAVRLLSQLSVGLVIAGAALGMLWCHQHLGRYLTGNAKEMGALCVSVWFVVLSVAQRCVRVSERLTMLMCIGGNVIVSLAWFGAALLDDGRRVPSYLPLALSILLGIHLVFLVMGLAPAPDPAES